MDRVNLKNNVKELLKIKGIRMLKGQRKIFQDFIKPTSRIHNETIINELKKIKYRKVNVDTSITTTVEDEVEVNPDKDGNQEPFVEATIGLRPTGKDTEEMTAKNVTFYKIARQVSYRALIHANINDILRVSFNVQKIIINNIRNKKGQLVSQEFNNITDKPIDIHLKNYPNIFSFNRKNRLQSQGSIIKHATEQLFYHGLIKDAIIKHIKNKNYSLINDTDYLSSKVSLINVNLNFSIIRNKKINLKNLKVVKQYFKRGDINCVIKCIMEQAPKVDKKRLEELKTKYKESGVSYEDLEDISKRLFINFRVQDINKNIKHELKLYKDKKIVTLMNNEFNHVETCEHGLFETIKEKEMIHKTQDEINDVLNNPDNEYYKIVKIVKCKEQLIFNDFVFTTKEYAEQSLKIKNFMNINLSNNMNISTNNIDLYELSFLSVHYPSVFTNIKCDVKDSDLIALDKNKAFASYRSNILYSMFMFPNGLDGVYDNKYNISADKIIAINGISQIKNIKYNNVKEPLYSHLTNINFLENMNVYPNNYLYYLWSKGVRFNIKKCAISYSKKDIIYTEDDIKHGIYKQVYGILQMSKFDRYYHIYGSSETLNLIMDDLKNEENYEIMKHSTILYNKKKEEDIIDDIIEDKEIKIDDLDFGLEPNTKELDKSNINDQLIVKKKINYTTNQSYISGYIIGYSLIETLSKLEQIEHKDVKSIRCDEITTHNKYESIFDLDENDITKWKKKKVNTPNFNSSTLLSSRFFINPDEELFKSQEPYILTEHKLKYTNINLITGAAGSGKSKRFLRTYDNNGIISDERIHNCFFLLPSHDLVSDFKEENKNNECLTYQRFITKGFEDSDYFKHLLKYNNIIIDESSFINTKDTQKIINLSNKYKFNLFFISDIDNTRAYQLKPVEGDLTSLSFYKSINNLYHLHLDKVKRCNGELLDRLNKIRAENLTDSQILELFKDRIVKHDVLFNKYKPTLENIIICPVNNDVARHNYTMYNRFETVISKDPETLGHSFIKNKRRITTKQNFIYKNEFMQDINNYLGYSITAHLSQGKTYAGDVFIVYNNMYCDNLFYVMLSRATDISKIHIITKMND